MRLTNFTTEIRVLPAIAILRCAVLLSAVALLSVPPAAEAQAFTTTTVQGTVYLANGTPGSGTLQLSWPAFTTAANQAVAAGHTIVTVGTDGFVSVSLAPNLGSLPAGLFYTAVFNMSDGTVSTEYWVVPAAAEATIAKIRAQIMPAAQAIQAVSKSYVDESIAELSASLLTASGGNLTGPLYLNGDPTTPLQAADKRYVDNSFALALPLLGGVLSGPVTGPQIGAVYQADQFAGADFGAKVQACLNGLNAAFGGTCDARNFAGSQVMGTTLTIATANVTVNLPCATITTSQQIVIPVGTRNVTLHGCATRGTSAASGSQGGTVFMYSGTGAFFTVGDPTYATDTPGFRLDNVAINTTTATAATAQAFAAFRTQELSLEELYLLGNANQTGLTLDGTGNYTGGTFQEIEFTGFQIAVNAIGHQVANAATTDWLNASTFVRLHIDCPTSGGNPVAGTVGINLARGDGNTFTGGDVEGCSTALHLGANAQNNTIVGLRNENSTNQIVADAGSSYNNWMTGGTMYTGRLTDNGTRNSFLDTFHRSFNELNGDWYGSQQDATVTNHYRLGIGNGNERGLENRYQTDFGYRWTMGLSDATAGQQFYSILDELNSVSRISIGQYNNGQSSTNNQTVVNSAGTGAVVLNGSTNAGTGGVVFGAGGTTAATVATISSTGNAQFNGTLLVSGTSQSTGTMTVRNNADAEVDYYLWPGLTTSQKGSLTYKDWNGNSQWYMVKDQYNNWALNSATGGLDSFKAYQSTNSGDTYIDASNSSGTVRVNYETGAGTSFNIYGGSSTALYASFTGTTSIKFPGLAAATGHGCLQVDTSGFLTNTGSGCGSAAAGLVGAGGLTFADGTTQTTSEQGALTGSADDSTARASATAAQTTANTAQTTASTASTSASSAVTTANAAQTTATTASTNASSAVTTANAAQTTASTASTNASSALSGSANDSTSRTSAATAQTTANTASTSATAAQTTATTASTNASAAVTTANAASTNASSALSGSADDSTARASAATAVTTANTASTNATAAQTTATTASTNASSAVTTANAALPANGMTSTGGSLTAPGTLTVKNGANAEVDYILQPGTSATQKGSFIYRDYNSTNEWYLVKDTSNNWALNSAIGGLDSLKAYQSTNSGDTYIDASNSTGVVRVNYETGAGTSFNIYGGSSSTLYASFTGTTSIKFPGLAATTGHGCLQVDTSGFMTNSGVGCGLAAVGSAGLTFYDGTIQTTTEQGALTGSADDSTARTSAAAAQTTATAALPANGLTSSTGGNLTASGTVTANTVSVPNAHRAYGNRSDILDAVADCGEVGDGVTNNSTARASCLSAHPLMTEFFPPRYWNGTADVQTVYYASATTNLPTQSGLASTGGDYGCPRGAILSYPAGVTGITMQQASQVHDLCVEGSEPASVTGTDGYNAIFPSGASLLEYQEVVTSINVTSNVLTINFAAGTRTWWLAGGEVQVVLPSPYTSLNGYYYLTSVVESTGSGANITVAAPGAAAVATTTISGTCPGAGCVLPATTGTSNSDGIDAEGAFAKLDHVYVSKFGHNGVEIDGSDYISDDPSLKNVTTYGNRGHGLYVHGGDANQGYYDDYVGYFNGIYCAFDVAFLSSTYVNPQCSYNDGYGAAAAGTAETISSIARTVASNVNTVAVVTSTAMPHIAVGNAICVSGVTDTSFNTCTAATASGFVTAVTSSTQFTYIQPGYGLSNSTSSGGTIQLPTRTQLYTLAAFDGGSYTVGRNNNAGNYVMINPYNEGDGAVVQPGACANRFNLGVVIVNGHMGNCTDPNWLGSAESANGLNGMTFPPHTDEAQVTPVVSNESGGGQDTNSLQNYKDLSMTPAGLSGQVDLRLTAPGQTTSWLGLRTNTNADQAGMYNYAALFGYGASASAGATTTIGSSTFIGSGTNDMTVSGTSTLASTASYSVEVCATGTPDSFCWAVGAGSYSAPVAITGAAQSLQNGLTATFASTTGHALNNSWGFTVTFAAGARPQLWVPNALRLGNSSYSVTRKFAECAATPTSTQSPDGQWFAGDWCYNDMATTNTILAWVCTVSSGTPSACSNWYAVPNTGAVVTAVNVVTNGGITNTGTTTAPNLECTAATTTQAGCATLSLSSPTPTPIDGYCEGTIGTAVSGSYMLAPFALRNAATPSCSANGTNSTVNSFVTPGSCTARNLYVRSTTAGASASACSVKFYHNGAATALSCLLGTGTSCNDTTDTVSIAAGDTYGIEVVTSTAGSDACGGITAALQCY